MAQKRFHNYKAALDSNDFTDWLLGLLEPGRYRGFDNLIHSGGLTFELNHVSSGVEQTKENLTQSPPTGVIFTKQGIVIQEDGDITGLSISSNGANAFERIDIVYMDHQDVNILGGQAATYGVVTGPLGGSALPPLPNPERQILIGQISIPASVTDIVTSTWVPNRCPSLAGHNIFTNYPELEQVFAGKFSKNLFTKMQQFSSSATVATVTLGRLDLNDDGNVFFKGAGGATVNEIEARGNGTFIWLYKTGAGGAMDLVLNQTPTQGGLPIRMVSAETYGITQVDVSTGSDPVALIQVNDIWYVMADMDTVWDIINALEAEITVLEGILNTWTVNTALVVTPSSGTFTPVTVKVSYKKNGKTAHISVFIEGTFSAGISSASMDLSALGIVNTGDHRIGGWIQDDNTVGATWNIPVSSSIITMKQSGSTWGTGLHLMNFGFTMPIV